ncbi:MAG: 3-deoxy-manno-octulosonate cytidylyltransferase [Marinobacter sp.]|nr:3-deoxy-manno-octulosonate cytidylyltransferase [Marinobacter sp.]
MSFTVIIPARYASTRLPGKPLLDIAGKPMIQHVWQQAKASHASRVIVATDDARIQTACEAFGAEVVMTAPTHPSGTDRLEEVVRQLGLDEDDMVVNVQGDEPLIPPALINQVAANLDRFPEAGIATLCERIHGAGQVFNPNVVKVVFDYRGMASYFSRAPIPWARENWAEPRNRDRLPSGMEYYRHIGIYGYRVGFLRDYVTWAPAPTEETECLEQLRALYRGVKIHVDDACERPPAGVDTQEDLERLRRFMEEKL